MNIYVNQFLQCLPGVGSRLAMLCVLLQDRKGGDNKKPGSKEDSKSASKSSSKQDNCRYQLKLLLQIKFVFLRVAHNGIAVRVKIVN